MEVYLGPYYAGKISNYEVPWSEEKPADEEILRISDKLKKAIEEYSGVAI